MRCRGSRPRQPRPPTRRPADARGAAGERARRPRYQLGERLGVGGTAEVFRGWQIGAAGFERPVAIKRLLPQLARNDPDASMIAHEADLLARMRHPNILHVLDLVRDDEGQLLLVLEYVDGIHLRKLFLSGPLPHTVIVFLAAEILNGLGHAHHLPASGSRVLGIVHRDLSPDNILLSWEGAVKIADFGIARPRQLPELPGSPIAEGKPGYTSPEQRRGEPLDGRSDLYSVGVILWELLAHERLCAPGIGAPLDRAPRPSAHRPTPCDLEAVVMKLLHRDRERRYRTAAAAYDAIARCDGTALLRGRADLVELLAERFPERAARGWTRQPRRRSVQPLTPATPTMPASPTGLRALSEASSGRMQRHRWVAPPRREPRWSRHRGLAMAIVILGVAAVLGLVAWIAVS